MTRLGVIGFAAMCTATAYADTVAISIRNGHLAPRQMIQSAQLVASRIYSAIGVDLRWTERGASTSTLRLVVTFDSGVPETSHPGALGYAEPYGESGALIHIFCNRVFDRAPVEARGWFLGHVMAHEIGHQLQGISRHSATGVMKGCWGPSEFKSMAFRPLAFEAMDAELIHVGIQSRIAKLAAASAPVS